MNGAREVEGFGRLANVSAALILPGAKGANDRDTFDGEPSRSLGRLFEDVVVVGGDAADPALASAVRVPGPESGERNALADLAGALAAAREDQVLVVASDLGWVTPDLLLALIAWPEHDCVAPRIDGEIQPLCCLYRRDPTLGVIREVLDRGESDLAAVFARLDCGILEGEDLAALIPQLRLA